MLKGTGSPDEIFSLKAYQNKSVLFVNAQLVFQFLRCLGEKKNK
jgi:hypothetical protein